MARTFDGVDDQIAFGSDTAVDGLTAWTAYILIRITADVTSERQLLTKMRSDFQGKMYLAAVGAGGSNNKVFTISTRNGGNNVNTESVANVLAVDTWKVVISTWAGDGSAAKIFSCTIGEAIAEVGYAAQNAGSGAIADDSSATLRIAARDPVDATFFAGGCAGAALWNRVLTADELTALGRGFSPDFFPRGRVLNCRVDGRTSPERNLASGGTDGTVTGTTFLDHPPVMYSGKHVWLGKGSTAAPFNVVWATQANVLLGTGRR